METFDSSKEPTYVECWRMVGMDNNGVFSHHICKLNFHDGERDVHIHDVLTCYNTSDMRAALKNSCQHKYTIYFSEYEQYKR
jgi:hypothetical protein